MKIEKGIPLPHAPALKTAGFEKMEVGDSIFFQGMVYKNSGGGLFHQFKKYPDWKFTCRSIDGGVRVWRIK